MTSGSAYPRRRHGRALRWLALLALAALFVGTLALLPAVAGSETVPTINAISTGAYRWEPSQVALATGASADFGNPSESVPHGVEWTGGPARPTCTGVPTGGAYNWQGSCAFAQEGTYTFRCSVHHYMTGTVTVGAGGTVTTTTTSTLPPLTTSTSTATTTSGATGATGGPYGGGEGAGGGAGGAGGRRGGHAPGRGRAGPRGAAGALALALHQRGLAVRVSMTVPRADASARLTVRLLARARGGHPVAAGRLLLRHVRAGHVALTIALDRAAKAALRRRRGLALTVAVALSPRHGRTLRARRRLRLRAA